MVSLYQGLKREQLVLIISVRGEVLDLAFLQATPHARFVMCGGKFRIIHRLFAREKNLIVSQVSANTTQ